MKYRSTFLEPDGTKATAVFQAEHEDALALLLQDSERILLRAKPLREARLGDGRSYTIKKLLPFTNAMESLLEAGVPILGALEAIRDHEKEPRAAKMFSDIIQRIENGDTLANSFGAYPRAFPKLYIELIGAGEMTGSLGSSFGYLAKFLEWQQGIRKLIKQATIYPLVLLTATYFLILAMLAFTLPRLKDMLMNIADELPPSTKVLMAASDVVAANVGMVLLGTVVVVAAIKYALKSQAGSRVFMGMLLRLPVASTIVLSINLSIVCRTLGILLQSGVTLIQAIQRTGNMVSLPTLAKGLANCVDRLTDGEHPSEAFEKENLFPDLALVMVRAGEQSGDLNGAFGRLGATFDEDAQAGVKRAIAIMEPMMTAMLALIVLGVAAIVLNTLYSAFQGIGA